MWIEESREMSDTPSLSRAMKIAFFALVTSQRLDAVDAAIYKWVDEKGVTHYW